MTYLTPYQREQRDKRLAIGTALAVIAIIFTSLVLDRAIFHATYVGAGLAPEAAVAARDRLRDRDWQEALRALGYVPTWFALAIAFIILGAQFAKPNLTQLAVRLVAATAIAGAIAEILKPTIGRLRPLLTDGQQRFVALGGFREAGDNLSFGLASSHAAVAAAAAFTIAFAFPPLTALMLILALGCGLTRLMTGAHFASDVLASFFIAYAVARTLREGGWSRR